MRTRDPAVAARIHEVAVERIICDLVVREEVVVRHEACTTHRERAIHAGIQLRLVQRDIVGQELLRLGRANEFVHTFTVDEDCAEGRFAQPGYLIQQSRPQFRNNRSFVNVIN